MKSSYDSILKVVYKFHQKMYRLVSGDRKSLAVTILVGVKLPARELRRPTGPYPCAAADIEVPCRTQPPSGGKQVLFARSEPAAIMKTQLYLSK